MAKNIIIYGVGYPGATIEVKYRISGSADPYTTVNIPSEDLPYTILSLPDEDYEVIYKQICPNEEESTPVTIDPIAVCVCTAPVIAQGQVGYDLFQVFYNYVLGSSYTLYVDEVAFVIGSPTGSYMVSGLEPDRTYTVYIVRTLPNGVKCTSNIIDITTTDVAPCPGVTDLTAELTATTALLMWTAAAGALTYNIYIDGSLVANTADTDYLATGLTPGQAYVFAVVPICETGYGVLVDIEEILPVNVECEPPSNLLAISITDTTIQLSFTPWDVAKPTRLYLDNVFVIELAAGIAVYNFTGLTPDTTYNITAITVCSSEVSSDASAVKSVKTTLIHPPVEFNASNPGSTTMLTSWNADPEAINYTLYKNGVEETTVANGSSVLFYNFEGLTPNTAYNFTVRANYPSAGPLATQTSTTLPVVCGKATNVVTTVVGNTHMGISWGLSGQSISSQDIYVNGVLYASVSASTNTRDITGLDQNFLYTIYIITHCANGGLSQSDDLIASTTNVTPYTNLVFTVNHDNYIYPNWQPTVNFDTDTAVRAYRVRASQLYIEFNDYADSGEVANLAAALEIISDQVTPEFLQFIPIVLEITSYLYNGDTIIDTYWYVFDFTDKPNGFLLNTITDLPIVTVTALGSTTVDLLVTNLASVIGGGETYDLTAYLMKSDDLDSDNSAIEQVNVTVSDTGVIAVTGLTTAREYFVIVRWENTTTPANGYCIPIGIVTT